MIQTCTYLYSITFTPQVKQERNQSQVFNRKSISHNATHRQSLHLQAMLTGEMLKGWNKGRESRFRVAVLKGLNFPIQWISIIKDIGLVIT